MAELRRRVFSLRGAVALAGVAAVTASMTQVVGTMAAPAVMRTATIPASTANYFPAPLPDSISCTDDAGGRTGALVSWPSAGPQMSYRVQVSDGTTLVQTAYTDQTSFRPSGLLDLTYRVAVSTVNTGSGTSDDDRVVSTGSRSHDITLATSPGSQCVADSQAVTPNQPWENQAAWAPATPAPAGVSMFVSLAEELKSGELAAALPGEDSMGELADVESTTLPPPTSPAEAPASDSGAASPTGTKLTGTKPTGTVPTGTAASTPAPPSTGPSTRSPSTEPPSPDDPLPSDSVKQPRQEAALGDDPIAVGTAHARLDLVDGVPHVIVTSGETHVCMVPVSRATAITETEGILEVTGGDQTRAVDPATCAVT